MVLKGKSGRKKVKIKIGNKTLGDKVYVIAEAGVNHNGSLERAKELVIKAAQAGTDAIKFQTYTADELVVKGTPKFWDAEVDKDKEGQHEAYKALEGFKDEWYPELIKCCEENNIEFLSTPFSFAAADFLNSLGMKAFKIASSDMSTLPFLEHVAKFKKPILLSTGASTLAEIIEAVETIKEAGNKQIVVMHCNLNYPTKDEDANLGVIKTLKAVFPDLVIGLSDHTLGTFPPIIAAAMGAKVIEKHYTVDKTLPESADHWLSVDPTELKEIVDGVKRIELLYGDTERRVFPSESETRKYDKRSLVSKRFIAAGTEITEDMLTYKRPGTGIPPKFKDIVVGRIARRDIREDCVITWRMI